MGLYRQDGTRITKAAFPAAALEDPPVRVTEDVYVSEPYGRGDGQPEGSKRFLLYQAGTIVLRSVVDRLFTTAAVASISPAKGPAAGGTTITVKGVHLDGVSTVTFGGTAGTDLHVRSASELTVKTPPGEAGAATVELVDDGGTVSAANGFTYEAPAEG
ncbi:IPT/TIG domain-containing protein [Streptomyces albidoflavus]|uniref:IPT/TIG domain-containing protein n=1 Tax=Streptomyces albidoflavus TaxID=1886 RepID=UPI000A1C98A6|nr:IPT/TIG domain-containing protein [Streptomyces albidoflavus]